MVLQLTQDFVVMIVAVIVSILLTFMPGIKDWWANHDRDWKARVIIIVCFVIATTVYVLACFKVSLTLDAVCPAYFNSPLSLMIVLYSIGQATLIAAGTVQTVYQYGLQPTKDWLAAKGPNSGAGPG
jgi:hypothetical protein